MDVKDFYRRLAPRRVKEGYSKLLEEHWCQLKNGYIVFFETGIIYTPEEAAMIKEMDDNDKVIMHQIKANCLIKGIEKPVFEQKQLQIDEND